MPIKVNLPDGRVVNFPDGMPPEQIEAEVRKLAPLEPAHETAAPTSQKPSDRFPQITPENFDAAMAAVGEYEANRTRAGREALPVVGGMAGAMLGGVPGAALGGATGEAFRQLDRRIAGEPVPATSREAATDIGTQGAVQGAIEGAGKGVQLIGKGLYKGGVALLPKTLKQQHPNIAATGIKEGIALTRRGADKAGRSVGASRAEADALLATAEKSGAAKVPTRKVVQAFRPVRDKMQSQAALGLPDETPALAARAKSFAAKNRGGLALTKAQTLKREAQNLADTAYKARDRGAVINSMEALTNEAQARGLREGIESIVPAVGPVNARTQALMGVKRGAEHAAETGHILSRLGGAGVSGAVLGSAGGLVPMLAGAGAGAMLTTPGGLTSTGLALTRTGRMGPQLLRAALLAKLLEDEGLEREP